MPDPDPCFDELKLYSEKFIFKFFLLKIAIYLSIGHHKERTRYRRSLEPSREHPVGT
jgi:hypothetical protein